MKTFKISYVSIKDGRENGDTLYCHDDGIIEYGGTVIQPGQKMTDKLAIEVISDFLDIDEEDEFQEFLKAKEIVFGDGETIKYDGWQEVFPVVVHVSGGVVQGVDNIPQGVTVEVHDYDDDQRAPDDPNIAIYGA